MVGIRMTNLAIENMESKPHPQQEDQAKTFQCRDLLIATNFSISLRPQWLLLEKLPSFSEHLLFLLSILSLNFSSLPCILEAVLCGLHNGPPGPLVFYGIQIKQSSTCGKLEEER
ncbi:hypothetical protein Cadr_000006314 [Camelus dromedarius]|uniref:Uncharacterized protein n=1 Tax=Camelus dromedarius TaxID=9838 RepID=A0A5N4E1H0_CAMDR|nr:hypothetical protein Cadr_000006314 [Camelus dromedarius]